MCGSGNCSVSLGVIRTVRRPRDVRGRSGFLGFRRVKDLPCILWKQRLRVPRVRSGHRRGLPRWRTWRAVREWEVDVGHRDYHEFLVHPNFWLTIIFGSLLFSLRPNFWFTIIIGSTEFLVHLIFWFNIIISNFSYFEMFGLENVQTFKYSYLKMVHTF